MTSCQTQITRIVFPQLAAQLHKEVPVEFRLSDEEKALLGQKLPLYRIISRRGDGRKAENYDASLFKLFGHSNQSTNEYDGFTEYRCNDNGRLKIYKNGSFAYFKGTSSEATLKLSDEEVVRIARKYLSDNGLLPDGFEASDRLGGQYTGGTTPVMKSVGFFRKIDGYEMWGRSDIVVEVQADGIRSVTSIYSDYKFERKISSMTYEEVQKLTPHENGQIEYDTQAVTGEFKSIVLEDVQILYYDSPVNQPELTHILPVYQFNGTIYDVHGNSTEYTWTVESIAHDK